MTHHRGYSKHSPSKGGNARNGKSKKGLLTDHGRMEMVSPRDRNGSFEPVLVKKRQTRFDGFYDKILSMYARGMTVREIQGHLEEIYAVEVSPDLISRVTDSVLKKSRLGKFVHWMRSIPSYLWMPCGLTSCPHIQGKIGG